MDGPWEQQGHLVQNVEWQAWALLSLEAWVGKSLQIGFALSPKTGVAHLSAFSSFSSESKTTFTTPSSVNKI